MTTSAFFASAIVYIMVSIINHPISITCWSDLNKKFRFQIFSRKPFPLSLSFPNFCPPKKNDIHHSLWWSQLRIWSNSPIWIILAVSSYICTFVTGKRLSVGLYRYVVHWHWGVTGIFWRTSKKKCKPEAGTINEALSVCPACSLYGLRMLKVRGWRRGHMLDSRSEAALSAPSKHGSFSGASNAGWVSFTSSFFNLKRQQRESCT